MPRPLTPDVATWGEADQAQFFRLLGLKLEDMSEEGRWVPDVSDAIYVIAADLVEDASGAVPLSDDISDDIRRGNGIGTLANHLRSLRRHL
jgi:hypothetical protein